MKEYNYKLGDIVEMKKPHPCTSKNKLFKIVRIGADLKIECLGCKKIMLISRDKFNQNFKKIVDN